MANWLIPLGVTVSGILAFVMPHTALAKPLSSEACVQLVNEHSTLAKSGVEQQLKGEPASAGTTLKAEQLANIDRYLFIEGQIRFRCPEIKLPGMKSPAHSKEQAAEFQKRATREAQARKAAEQKAKEKDKPAGGGIPLPDRNPKRQAKAAG